MAALTGLVGWVMMAGLVEPASLPGWYRCPFEATTGLYCAGCGSTRATRALTHADVPGSLRANPLVLLLGVPAVVAVFVSEGRVIAGRARAGGGGRFGFVGWLVLAVVLVFWVLRNVPWAVFEVLRPGAVG